MRKLLVLLAALGLADAVYAADSFTGTWKLDTAKSKIESFPAPKEETLTERKQAGITDMTATGINEWLPCLSRFTSHESRNTGHQSRITGQRVL